ASAGTRPRIRFPSISSERSRMGASSSPSMIVAPLTSSVEGACAGLDVAAARTRVLAAARARKPRPMYILDLPDPVVAPRPSPHRAAESGRSLLSGRTPGPVINSTGAGPHDQSSNAVPGFAELNAGETRRNPPQSANTYTIEDVLAYFNAAGLVPPVQCG